MSANNPVGWRSTRRSLFLPNEIEPELRNIESSHYADMFREDISMLLPSYDAGPVIRLEPENHVFEKLIEEAIQWHHHGIGLAAEVSEFIQLAARTIARYGTAYYEISFETREGESEPSQFHIHPLQSESLIVRRGEVYQRVPPEVAHQRGVGELIHIPRETLCVMTPGDKWSSEFRRITEGLTTVSRVIVPDFAQAADTNRERAVPFDVMQFFRTQRLAVLSITKDAGWNARRLSNGDITGYYWLRRWLRFERLKIRVRNALIERFNETLSRVGAKLGFSGRITVSGLPQLNDVTTAEQQLEGGTVLLGEIMKPFIRA